MRLLPIAQKLAEAAATTLVFDESHCLREMDRFSDCQTCFTICPAGAIEAGSPPTFDVDSCQYCRACLPICPMGAFTYTGIDAAQALAECVEMMKVKSFELFCQLNPNVERVAFDAEAAIRVRGCLAGLGVGIYLALASRGLQKVLLRTDACDRCAWQMLRPTVESQVKQAQGLLALWGRDSFLSIADDGASDKPASRPVWQAESPPVSRRGLVQRAARESGEGKDQDTASSRFRERLRILKAINRLPSPGNNGPVAASEEVLGALSFALVSVSESCTACGTCARVCPTGALEFSNTGSTFELIFIPQLCIGCEFCAHICAPQAITCDHDPAFDEVLGGPTEKIVQQGDLAHCPKCKAPFAARNGSRLCPPCEFRQKNPFGSFIPPGAKI